MSNAITTEDRQRGMTRVVLRAAVAAAIGGLACGSDQPSEDGDSGGSGNGSSGIVLPTSTSLDDASLDGTAVGTAATDTGCGGELFGADNVPPNVLITLDRSGSMNDEIDNGMSKWEIAQDAIAQVTADFGDQVFFGLSLFPGLDSDCNDGMDCGAGAVFIDPAPMTADMINAELAAASTCSFGTPIAEHLDSLPDYAGLEDIERPNYILLITDGQATCDDPVPAVEALRAEDPEIKTFVVGFGSEVDPQQLADMAEAGGTALPGDPSYYQADDAQSLVEAFAAIAGSVLSCSYVLSEVPSDPDQLYVFFDGMLLDRDETHTDGWDYDPATNRITFYGPACDALQSGQVAELSVVFGCPMIP
jgi:hypothetical protein